MARSRLTLIHHIRRFGPRSVSEGNRSPVLYAVSERFEAYAAIMNKVLGDFVFVQPTTVTVVETLR